MRMFLIVGGGVVAAIVLALAAMIVFGTDKPAAPLASISRPFDSVDFSDLPPIETIPTRRGSPIAFRVWPGSTSAPKFIVIAIHGSSASSSSLHPLAKALGARGVAVYAPDIRGHGNTGTRGDIDYATQLDDDLADFTAAIAARHPDAKLVLLGFSSGGGFALHIDASPLGAKFTRVVLISPMLGPLAPTYRPGNMWAAPYIPRIIAIAVLRRLGIHAFDHLPALAFAVDPRRGDILTGSYSFLLTRAFGTNDYAADLRQAHAPVAVLVGGDDELFDAGKFAPTIAAVRPDIPVTIVPGLGHIEMTTDPRAMPAIVAAVRGEANK